MPKIFLIKNRLHQQQLRLQEAQHGGKNVLDIAATGDGRGSPEPLSLIVQKKEEGKDCDAARQRLVISTVDAERNRRVSGISVLLRYSSRVVVDFAFQNIVKGFTVYYNCFRTVNRRQVFVLLWVVSFRLRVI